MADVVDIHVEIPKNIMPFIEMYGDVKHGSVMSPDRSKEEFGILEMPMMRLKERSDKRYKVYKNLSESVEVEANTAQEAISASGVEKPYKVVHLVMDLNGVLEQSMLIKIEPEQIAPEAVASETVTSETVAPEVIPPQEDTQNN